MSGGNFVDLRITHAGTGSSNEDSVWPAFTDIMTVIVMIFLMVLLAFLIKNAQLVDELKTTITEKEAVTKQALTSATQNLSLEEQLASVRRRILLMEGTLGEANAKKDALSTELEIREQRVNDLGLEVALLSKLRDELTKENSELLSSLDLSNKTLLDFKAENAVAKNVLNEKISLLLAEKSGLLIDVENNVRTIEEKEADRLRLTSQVISLSEQLKSLGNRLDLENERATVLARENRTLSSVVDEKNSVLLGLETSREDLLAKLEKLASDLEQLQTLYNNRGEEVTSLQAQMLNSTNRYKSLQEEYDSLDTQYRKLIRPARSTAGKVVVEVIYSLRNGEEVYQLKEQRQSSATRYSFANMHARLAELKKQYGGKLYTKVRIDDDSGVSFNNAWKFTNSILSQYDYYAEDFSDSAAGQ